MTRRRVVIDAAEVARRYLAGASEYELAGAYGVSRAVIRRRLHEAEIPIRSWSAAGRVRARKMSPEQRRAQTAAAQEAWRTGPRKTAPPVPVEDRFWSFVNKTDTCWLWTGSRSRHRWGGYGRINTGDASVQLAHRVSWEMANGPVPTGLYVLHRCDNPPCVRPDHLFLGTGHDNNIDMARKRRGTHGEKNRHSKLTAATVRAIRAAHAAGAPYSELAEAHGVTINTVSRAVRRLTWKHI